MHIDHIVLWVSDQQRSLDFFVHVVGLEPVRANEFASGETSFPSVRVSDDTILDLMDSSKAPGVRAFTGGEAGGALLNHVCLSMTADEYRGLERRLAAQGQEVRGGGSGAFGALGAAAQSAYFQDPDGNVLEMRHYAPREHG